MPVYQAILLTKFDICDKSADNDKMCRANSMYYYLVQYPDTQPKSNGKTSLRNEEAITKKTRTESEHPTCIVQIRAGSIIHIPKATNHMQSSTHQREVVTGLLQGTISLHTLSGSQLHQFYGALTVGREQYLRLWLPADSADEL